MAATPFTFQHALDFLKGWPSPSAIDYDALVSSNVTSPNVNGGRVVHVNSAGQFEMGAVGTQMPMYLIQGANEADVNNVSPIGALGWTGVMPSGKQSALVAVGAYELQTTEFDPAATFNINDALHAPVEAQITGSDKSAAGQFYKTRSWPGGSAAAIAPSTDAICGIVSRIPSTNPNKQATISFWPYFYPGPTSSA